MLAALGKILFSTRIRVYLLKLNVISFISHVKKNF